MYIRRRVEGKQLFLLVSGYLLTTLLLVTTVSWLLLWLSESNSMSIAPVIIEATAKHTSTVSQLPSYEYSYMYMYFYMCGII